MPNKLLLIDGHNLLFQMFYGMPNKIEGKDGKSIEGVWGFTSALLKMIKKVEPTHILVIFEGEETLNRQIMGGYKKNLVNMIHSSNDKNPFLFFPEIKAVLSELKIPFFETKDGLETSDYIKEYCETSPQNYEIVISSLNYNYVSLITERISLLTYRGVSSTLYNPAKVESKWKIKPAYFADYKALVGDTSDNIAGIPRIGPKMAANLIQEFGHVEDILNSIDQITKENVRLTLDIFKKDLLTNLELIRFKGTKDLPISFEDLTYDPIERNTKEILTKVEIL